MGSANEPLYWSAQSCSVPGDTREAVASTELLDRYVEQTAKKWGGWSFEDQNPLWFILLAISHSCSVAHS